MKLLFKKIIVFILILAVIGELAIRQFHLAPDIPSLYLDSNGIQRYVPGQTGYFTKAEKAWSVNRFGWLGVCDTSKDTIISIIGDSYIENIMNPIECNQGSYLKTSLPQYSFFEAGRSGITFIEALEISHALQKEIHPAYQLLYINENDFYESVSEINRYDDRVQISIQEQKILKSEIKNPGIKKLLYASKLAYYLYLKSMAFMSSLTQKKNTSESNQKDLYDAVLFDKLFNYCMKHYDMQKINFVLHPEVDERYVSLIHKYGIKTISLKITDHQQWSKSKNDEHWSCFGHEQVSNQVTIYLNSLMINNQ